MKSLNSTWSHVTVATLAISSLCALATACSASPRNNAAPAAAQDGGGGVDKRKLTTIQTSDLTVNGKKDAVEVRYLNLPYGAATFGYMEVGGDRYYSNRTWPIAHLTLRIPATWDGKNLPPGDYVFVLTPKNDKEGMTISLASFKPDSARGTFLTPGDVFTPTPKDAIVISKEPVSFDRGAPQVDQLTVGLEQMGDSTVGVIFHYGDRTHTEKLMLK